MSTAEQQALKFLTNQQDPELATLIHSQPLPAIAARITLDKLAQARMPLSYVALMQTLVSQQSEGAPEESSALALHCLVSKLTEMDSCFVCDVVLAMHAAGVSLNQPNTEKDTPLHLAARSGHLQLCQLLLQQGADPLARNSKNRTPSGQAKLNSDVKALLVEAESDAKEKRQLQKNGLWDEKMKATQTQSAYGVQCL